MNTKLNIILWAIVIAWGLLSIVSMSNNLYGNGLLEKIQQNSIEEDFAFNSVMAVYTGSVITPTLKIDDFPSPLKETYGAYARLFLPDGYITIAGLEWLPFLLFVLLITTLIVYSQKRKKQIRGDTSSVLWGLFLLFILIIALYPIWNAVHIMAFDHFYALTTSSTAEQAHSFYLGLAESMSEISIILIIIAFISILKLASIGARVPKVIK